MTLNDDQRKTFEQVARPLMKWVNENCHPYVTVVVDCTSAELSEGVCCVRTEDYIRD